MEAERLDPPQDDFLNKVKDLCHANGALLIFDEIVTGFRWHLGGAQKYHGVVPDLSTFGKAMGNGFSIAALVGKREIMELGGLKHDKEKVFLLSTTYGAETHALAAAIATMKVYESEPVIEHLYRQGERLARGVAQSVQEHHLEGYFGTIGKPCSLFFYTRDLDHQPSQPMRTVFMQEIIKRGIVAPSFIVSYSHTDEDIDKTVDAVNEALYIYRKALDEGYEKYLVGAPVKPAVRKFN
jgi:glutamate-1-semialdehyde 2,1-aminomutase